MAPRKRRNTDENGNSDIVNKVDKEGKRTEHLRNGGAQEVDWSRGNLDGERRRGKRAALLSTLPSQKSLLVTK